MPHADDEPTSQARSLVIVPAYNERQTVGRVVKELVEALPDCDVLVIDDGSTDGTAAQVRPPARVVTLPFNLGIGAAMQTGYRFAHMHGYDVAVQVDGDGQHPPAQVGTLIEQLHKRSADMVIGSRFLEPTGYRQTLSRRAGIALLGVLIRLLSGLRTTDCTSGFRAVNRRVIAMFAHWYPDDYPEPQVIPLLHRAGCHIVEVPVTMNERIAGQTSIPLLRGVFYVIKVATALMLDTIRTPWPTPPTPDIYWQANPDSIPTNKADES